MWLAPPVIAVEPDLIADVGHPLLAELLARRGIRSIADARTFLDPSSAPRRNPRDLPGVEEALARLGRAASARQKVLVWGDFDADGQTATALLVTALRRAGIDASWYVPDRLLESHGLSDGCLARCRDVGAGLVVTCDCAVGDREQIERLARSGVDTIVTDHHALLGDLADHPAVAVVSPRRLPHDHRFAPLAGVGVAFMLAEALLDRHGRSAEDLLDLVALGTIADVAALIGENRRLVHEGLRRLNRAERVGIAALRDVSGRFATGPHDAELAAWVLAPRLNAFGRLQRADPGVELLLTEDAGRAAELAKLAHELNAERQRLCEEVVASAERAIDEGGTAADPSGLVTPAAIFLVDPSWPVGIIGLAASRLAETYCRPVALAAPREDGTARVSMRAGPWCDLNAIVAEFSSRSDLGFRGGSHRAAAGGSLPSESLSELGRMFAEAAAHQCPNGGPVRRITIDAELRAKDATTATHAAVRRLAPFGAGNPTPLFLVRDLLVAAAPRELGSSGRHLAFTLHDGSGCYVAAVWWDGASRPLPAGRVDVCATLERDDRNGGEPRLSVRAMRPTNI